MSAAIPLQAQLAEVRREIALRERVYPKWIAEGKGGLTQATADRKLETMRAVAATLRALIKTHEELPL
jgi:signal recognition particle subunit SEC65